jgi:hypothetical protein
MLDNITIPQIIVHNKIQLICEYNLRCWKIASWTCMDILHTIEKNHII